MVAHLLNIDQALANSVAEGLGLAAMPEPATAAMLTRMDLPESPALSILKNAPGSFKGRKLGVLVTDSVDAELLDTIREAARQEGVVVELIAPMVGGVEAADGSHIEAQHKIDGGPSVVFDAVVVLAAEEGILSLLKLPPARDFVADAYAHYKFVGFSDPARKLFAKIGLPEELDDGFVPIAGKADATRFIEVCRALRFWDRPDGA
jgi:catalase